MACTSGAPSARHVAQNRARRRASMRHARLWESPHAPAAFASMQSGQPRIALACAPPTSSTSQRQRRSHHRSQKRPESQIRVRRESKRSATASNGGRRSHLMPGSASCLKLSDLECLGRLATMIVPNSSNLDSQGGLRQAAVRPRASARWCCRAPLSGLEKVHGGAGEDQPTDN